MITEPRTLAGFMELLPNEQILFEQMKQKIEKVKKTPQKDKQKKEHKGSLWYITFCIITS